MKVFKTKNFHFLHLFALLEYHIILMAFLHGMNSFFTRTAVCTAIARRAPGALPAPELPHDAADDNDKRKDYKEYTDRDNDFIHKTSTSPLHLAPSPVGLSRGAEI